MKRAIQLFRFDLRDAFIVGCLIAVASACGGSKDKNGDGTNVPRKGSAHIVIGATGVTATSGTLPTSMPVPTLPPGYTPPVSSLSPSPT